MSIKHSISIDFREIIAVVFIACICVFVFPVSGTYVTGNTAKLLKMSADIFQGKSIETLFRHIPTLRGPLLPMMLAACFSLFGKSVFSAIMLMRFFFVLTILMTYIVGRIFYNRFVGVIASILVLTSYGITRIAGNIDTDIVMPFFVLVFLSFWYSALKKRSYLFACISGIVVGIGYLIKESMVCTLLVPFLMIVFVSKKERGFCIQSGILILCTTLIVLFPWAVSVYKQHGSFLPILGVLHPEYQKVTAELVGYSNPVFYWLHACTIGLIRSLFKYHQKTLLHVTPFSVLMIIAFVYFLIRSLKYIQVNDSLLTIVIMAYFPLIIRAGDLSLRLGQTTFLLIIFYIMVVRFIQLACAYFSRVRFMQASFKEIIGFTSPTNLYTKKVLLCALLLVLFQLVGVWGRGSTLALWLDQKDGLSLFSHNSFTVSGRFTKEQKEAALWIESSVPKKKIIMADGLTNEALDFFIDTRPETKIFSPSHRLSLHSDVDSELQKYQKPLYVISPEKIISSIERYQAIFVIFQEDILQALINGNADYIVLSSRNMFLHTYFDRVNWATKVFNNASVYIYKINREKIEEIHWGRIGVNDSITRHIVWLKKNDRETFELLTQKLRTFGIDVDELQSTNLRFKKGEIY